MKINLYYIARKFSPGSDSVGRDSNFEYVSGPYVSKEQAKQELIKNNQVYDIVVDSVRVRLA